MKIIWGVYSRYEPTYRYEESLESIWSTKELAEEAAKKISEQYDHVNVRQMYLDTECHWMNPDDFVVYEEEEK